MHPRLKAGEPPTCSKCIYADVEIKCHYGNDKTVDKEPKDWCSHGKWVIKYKPNVYVEGLVSIVEGRARKDVRIERESRGKKTEEGEV